jgi:hypothetical protein
MGCSPDRLIGDDGLLEIKVPKGGTHISYLLKADLDKDYYPQAQGQLLVTGRAWVDMISYHPKMQPQIIRVHRNNDFLFTLTGLLANFNKAMREKISILTAKGYMEPL